MYINVSISLKIVEQTSMHAFGYACNFNFSVYREEFIEKNFAQDFARDAMNVL